MYSPSSTQGFQRAEFMEPNVGPGFDFSSLAQAIREVGGNNATLGERTLPLSPISTPSTQHVELVDLEPETPAPSSRPDFDFSPVAKAIQEVEASNSRLIEYDPESDSDSEVDFPEILREVDEATDEWRCREQVIVIRRPDEEVAQEAALWVAGMIWLGGLVWVGKVMLGPES